MNLIVKLQDWQPNLQRFPREMFEFHIGNLYTKIDKKKATKEEIGRISDLLAIKVEGAWFSKQYKMGRWDGKKKFYNRLTGQFFTGLLSFVKASLPDVPMAEVDERNRVVGYNYALELGGGWESRGYQIEAIHQAIEKKRGIIAMPTNSGKTEVACGIIKVLGLPANFITHRRRLLWQTKRRFEARLGFEIGVVGDQEEDIKDVNILSIHTLAKRLKSEDPTIMTLLAGTPVIFSDECHHISGESWERCLIACKSAYYRFGLSATALMRDSVSNMTVLGLTGDEIVTVTDNELTEAGISAFPAVFLKQIDQPKFQRHTPYDVVYEQGVMFNEQQNQFIVDTVKRWTSIGKSVFVIVFRIQHGELLQQMISEAGIDTKFIYGGDQSRSTLKSNDDVLNRFTDRTLPCVVSSLISDEGLDVPAIDVMIIAVGDESALKVVQRVGRGRRQKKEGANVVIIVDFIHTNNPYLKKHSKSRLNQYDKMGIKLFEVKDWDNVVELC